MTQLLPILIGFFFAVLAGEILRRHKDAFMSIIVIIITHGVVLMAMIIFATFTGTIHPLPVVLFWCGAFVFYFSARDLSENSILLRMIYLIKCYQPIKPEGLLDTYESGFGAEFRIQKLKDAGLIKCRGKEFEVHGRGKSVMKFIFLMTYFWKFDD